MQTLCSWLEQPFSWFLKLVKEFLWLKLVISVIQGNIDDDVESDIGAMPVQLPLTFHALRMKEKETESAAVETDVKGTLLYWFS